MRERAARLVSTLGHPALLTSAVGLWALSANGAPPEVVRVAAAIIGVIAVVVLGYGWGQVRRGAWAHIDASRPAERASHNTLGLAAFGTGAAAALLAGMVLLAFALIGGGLIMLAAIILAPRLKLSQHVAFGVLSAVVALWIAPWAAAAAALLTAALGWSRLQLGRHTRAEVIAGAVAGALAGALFALLLRQVAPG